MRTLQLSKQTLIFVFIFSSVIVFYSQNLMWQQKSGKHFESNSMSPSYHLTLAVSYISSNDLARAEEEFQKSIKLNPTSPIIHYKIANYYVSYFGQSKSNEAFQEYKTAMLFSDKDLQIKILEEVYANVTQDYLYLKKIIPNTDTARHSFAGFLRDKKLYEDAILEYGQLIKDASSNYIITDSYNWTAIICLWQGKFDEAMEYFNKAVGIAKDNKYKSWIFRNLGNMYLDKGDAQKAKETYKQAIKIDPAHWANYYGIGYVCEKMGSQREAANYYRKALQLNPGDYKPRILKRLEQLGR